jgi:hypothetical protein
MFLLYADQFDQPNVLTLKLFNKSSAAKRHPAGFFLKTQTCYAHYQYYDVLQTSLHYFPLREVSCRELAWEIIWYVQQLLFGSCLHHPIATCTTKCIGLRHTNSVWVVCPYILESLVFAFYYAHYQYYDALPMPLQM